MAEKKTQTSKKKPQVVKAQIYMDAEGDYRWRGLAGNNKIVAESGEGYVNRMYAAKMARSLCGGARIEFV